MITVQKVPVGARLVDSAAAQWSLSDCVTLKSNGVDGVVAYFESLTPAKLTNLTDAGLGVAIVGYARKPLSWTPNAQVGDMDAQHALLATNALATALGFDPSGLIQWCDLEGVNGSGQQVVDYLTAFGSRVDTVKQIGGCYEGADQPLDGQALWSIPTIHAYWCSFSDVPKIPGGYVMVQLWDSQPAPGGLGFEVDFDFAQKDRLGRQATWLKK